jgi:hypothetical protein
MTTGTTDALDDTDRATILAALRFYQNVGTLNSHDDDGNRLIDDEDGLDGLCERINCGAQPVASSGPAKTDAEIVDLCERAARIALDSFGGFTVPDDFVFHTSTNPRAVKVWGLAVAMVEEIAGHCVQSALAGVEGSTEAPRPPRPADPAKADLITAVVAILDGGSWHDDGTFVYELPGERDDRGELIEDTDDEGAIGLARAAVERAKAGG